MSPPNNRRGPSPLENEHRRGLLESIPVTERMVSASGVSTAVLEGGKGTPVVLLHGPGESAVNWKWIIPGLVDTHRVIAPDLPSHGSTELADPNMNTAGASTWLNELIEHTCASPPILVGHILGGAIAARYAVAHSDRLRHLVLVDSLGLGPFRPSPRFFLGLLRFQMAPSERSYDRFMRQCAYDLDDLRRRMGNDWETFVAYNLATARSPKMKAVGTMLRKLGIPRIPTRDLARITVPTTLIWGEHDRAINFRVAQRASKRFRWPLHVIPDAADDPPRDQPEAFLGALKDAVDGNRPEVMGNSVRPGPNRVEHH